MKKTYRRDWNYNDPEPKKGPLRLVAVLDRDSGKFFKSGVLACLGLIPMMAVILLALTTGVPLFLLLCIPAGMIAAPEICGCADTVMRSMRDEVGWWWWDTYRKSWKRNFRATLLPGGLFGLLLGVEVYLLYAIALLDNPTREFWMLAGALTLELCLLTYYMPMLVCMELPFAALVRNCFVLFFSHPLKSLLAAAVQLLYYTIILMWFPLTAVIFVLASVWVPMLLALSILYPVLDQHFGLKETYEKLQREKWEDEA